MLPPWIRDPWTAEMLLMETSAPIPATPHRPPKSPPIHSRQRPTIPGVVLHQDGRARVTSTRPRRGG